MNKTTSINLNSIPYTIDEDAYKLLKTYLTNLENYFKSHNADTDPDDIKEIIKDIEARIEEIMSEKTRQGALVISLENVQSTISTVGEPYQIENEEDKDENNESFSSEAKAKHSKSYKKLFRNPDNQMISGVCSGLGAYFGIDATWIRLLFLITIPFNFPATVVIYILLAIIVPKAISTAQKLQMEGKEPNIENIQTYPNRKSDTDSTITSTSLLAKIFNIFFIILLVCFASVIIITLLVAIFAIFSIFGSIIHTVSPGYWILILSIPLTFILPIYTVIRLIINFIHRNTRAPKELNKPLLFVWIIALLTTIFSVASFPFKDKSSHIMENIQSLYWDNPSYTSTIDTITDQNFNALDISSKYNVELHKDAEYRVIYEHSDKFPTSLTIENNKLELKNKPHNALFYSSEKAPRLKLIIYAPSYKSIIGSEGAKITAIDTLSSPQIELEASSGSTISCPIYTKEASIITSSGAKIECSGSSLYTDCKASSGSKIDATHFITQRADLMASSGGKINHIFVTKMTDAQASSSGYIRFYTLGEGHCEASSSGKIVLYATKYLNQEISSAGKIEHNISNPQNIIGMSQILMPSSQGLEPLNDSTLKVSYTSSKH